MCVLLVGYGDGFLHTIIHKRISRTVLSTGTGLESERGARSGGRLAYKSVELVSEPVASDAVQAEVDGVVGVHERVTDHSDELQLRSLLHRFRSGLEDHEERAGHGGDDPGEGDAEKRDGQFAMRGPGHLVVLGHRAGQDLSVLQQVDDD